MTHPTPTNAMINAGVAFAQNATVYRWPDYVRDLYNVMQAASPATPMPSSEAEEAIEALEELAGYCVRGRRVDKLFDTVRAALSKGAQPSQGVLEWRGNDLFYNGRCVGHVRWYSAISGEWSYKLAAEERVTVTTEAEARAALGAAAREWLFPNPPANKDG